MYIADTNIISEIMKPEPDGNVLSWFWNNEDNIYITAITVEELTYGVLRLPDGKRKNKLKESLNAIIADCADKIFPFDAFSAYLCAGLRLKAIQAGRTPTVENLMIASICQRNDAVLATRNTKDFNYLDIELDNPFEFSISAVN